MYLGNPIFCYFVSFVIVSITPFVKKPDSSRDIPIFMISFKSSFQNTTVAVPDPMFYLFIYLFIIIIIIIIWIAAFVADAVAVNQNDIKTILGNGLSKFTIKGKPFFF